MANDRASLKSALRRMGPAVMGLCLLSLPAAAYGANTCPWINEATASGLLGRKAVGEVTEAAAGQPFICTFTQQDESGKRTLRVTVEIVRDSHARQGAIAQACGADVVPLRAIGNEARICAADEHKNRIGERVVGRVRDQVFTITIYTTVKDDPILTRDELKSRIYTAAEQISGNLF